MKKDFWDRILSAKDPLSKFRDGESISACIYSKPFEGHSEVVRWFYSRNNGCQVFFACSKEVSDIIEADSWAEVSYNFTVYVESELMNYCRDNTNWQKCHRYGIDYSESASNGDNGCAGTSCCCEPFGGGDFTYGIANEDEFKL